MDMQDNSETQIENINSNDFGIIDSMYETVSSMKQRIGVYAILFFLSFLLKVYAVYNSNLGDLATDAKVIEVAVVNALGAIFQSVLVLNFFFFAINKLEFRITKVLWDIPTYIFFGFLMMLMVMFGIVFFVIPGLYVFYFYMALPMVAILFDEQDVSNFKITKNKVSKLGSTYFFYFILNLIISVVSTVVISYAPGAGIALPILYGVCVILTLVQDVMTGVIVSLFNKA